MRNSWVRAAVVGLIAGAVIVACDDNPVDEGREDPTRLQVNPGYATLDAADTLQLSASAVSRYGDATLGAVTFAACNAGVTFEADQSRVTLQPPDRVIVIGQTLGESCVVASSGSLTDTAVVEVVPASLVVTAAPDTLRAGDTGEVVVQTLDAAGVAVGPFARTDLTYATDDATVADLTDDVGSVVTAVAGQADITATWDGGGISREVSHTIVVIPNVPAAAAFESASFGAVGADGTSELEVIITDDLGNKNTFDNEILSVTAEAFPPGVVTVDWDIVAATSVNVIVTVTGQAAGSADITGEVTTSEGPLQFGPATVVVLDPIISTVSPSSGPAATMVTITGSGFTSPGFETLVTVGGLALGNFTVVSDTEIQAQMPTFGSAGSFDVEVDVGGVVSAAASWTQTADFDEPSTEPNDAFAGTPVPASLPFDINGVVDDVDLDDFFVVTLSQDGTISLFLDWILAESPDMDLLVTDAAFTAFQCGFVTATANHPESGTCALSAGDYFLWVNNFAPVTGTAAPYTITVDVQ